MTGHYMALADTTAKPKGDFHEQRVADSMSARIVDDLEFVKVDNEHRACAGVTPCQLNGSFQQLIEYLAVR